MDGSNSGDDYDYDPNGNLTQDLNKGISSISYNHLNKPTVITYSNGNIIRYYYNAVGMKLRQTVYSADQSDPPQFAIRKRSDYLGAIHYEDADGDGTTSSLEITFIQHEEGRYRHNGSDMIYEYNLTDHLGNTRITFGDSNADGDADILQENHYYPFGMAMTMSSTPTAAPPNDYLYNGKELQTELGLDWYDYGARMYDASIGRWNGVDPLSESYLALSAYNYTLNNPINFIDPDGRYSGWAQDLNNSSGGTPQEKANRMQSSMIARKKQSDDARLEALYRLMGKSENVTSFSNPGILKLTSSTTAEEFMTHFSKASGFWSFMGRQLELSTDLTISDNFLLGAGTQSGDFHLDAGSGLFSIEFKNFTEDSEFKGFNSAGVQLLTENDKSFTKSISPTFTEGFFLNLPDAGTIAPYAGVRSFAYNTSIINSSAGGGSFKLNPNSAEGLSQINASLGFLWDRTTKGNAAGREQLLVRRLQQSGSWNQYNAASQNFIYIGSFKNHNPFY